MKAFIFFVITIFFAICFGLVITSETFVPGSRSNLNFNNIIIASLLLFAVIVSLDLFLASIIFHKSKFITHVIRAISLGLVFAGIFFLRIYDLLSWLSLGIICIIYILIEITIFELSKK